MAGRIATSTTGVIFVLMTLIVIFPAAAMDTDKPTIAIIGTGDMGDSMGPRLAGLGYPVVYGTRDLHSEKVTQRLARTGNDARASRLPTRKPLPPFPKHRDRRGPVPDRNG